MRRWLKESLVDGGERGGDCPVGGLGGNGTDEELLGELMRPALGLEVGPRPVEVEGNCVVISRGNLMRFVAGIAASLG